ncbi:hypothetical protein [Acaryochloris marina]|uniref:hypothetical protein n=1 Tax=Acaryochloris marina TaxID=155978 RepID=UPI0021C33EAC|nr:hypothetical protein [Acaryochloris marina]BDM79194.1 hypothetical protein AM10699_20620 [Acaryochloris marina MBIC10699]
MSSTPEDSPISQKLGCHKYSIDSCILIKANVEAVTSVIREYFELEVLSHCTLSDYIDAEKNSRREVEHQHQVSQSRPSKSFPPIRWAIPVWQFKGHQWAILRLSGAEEALAFALSLLLQTTVITFYDSDNVNYKAFRVFGNECLLEHYLYGAECGEIPPNYWDIIFEDYDADTFWYRDHHFKSVIRSVDETELRQAAISRKLDWDDRGFLDTCLRYFEAYIPLWEETPHHYHSEDRTTFHQWDNNVARLDLILMPSNWKYLDWTISKQVL